MSNATTRHADHHDGMHVHIVPPSVLLGVFALLIVLTVVTVAVTKVDLGAMNIWIALLIAVAKAGAVGLYFMHLRYDAPFHGLVLVASLLFVALFISIALIDVSAYQVNMSPPGSTAVQTP